MSNIFETYQYVAERSLYAFLETGSHADYNFLYDMISQIVKMSYTCDQHISGPNYVLLISKFFLFNYSNFIIVKLWIKAKIMPET